MDDSCVVEGLWTFANSILLKNYKAAKRVPPTFDDPEVTHKIAFLDRDDVELGAIKFWRKVDSTFGIDIKLGNAGISIVGDNDNPSVSLVNTPVNDGPKEIVNVEYLNQALVPLNDALNALVARMDSLEDLYEDHVKPLITDPNGNFRAIHTTIHADASDANLPTCGAVYQYGKGISDALSSRIDNLPSVVDSVQDGNMHPVTSNAVADALASINNTLNELSSRISSIENNSGGGSEGGGSSGDSGGGSDSGETTLLYYKTIDNSPYSSGTSVDANSVELGKSFVDTSIRNLVRGRWVQTSAAIKVNSQNSSTTYSGYIWQAYFRQVS